MTHCPPEKPSPSRREIRQRAAEVRREWTRAERERRIVEHNPRAEVQVVDGRELGLLPTNIKPAE